MKPGDGFNHMTRLITNNCSIANKLRLLAVISSFIYCSIGILLFLFLDSMEKSTILAQYLGNELHSLQILCVIVTFLLAGIRGFAMIIFPPGHNITVLLTCMILLLLAVAFFIVNPFSINTFLLCGLTFVLYRSRNKIIVMNLIF